MFMVESSALCHSNMTALTGRLSCHWYTLLSHIMSTPVNPVMKIHFGWSFKTSNMQNVLVLHFLDNTTLFVFLVLSCYSVKMIERSG